MRCRCLMTMFLAILAAGAAGAGEPLPVEPPEPKWRAEIRRKLEKKVNFEFVQAPLSEAINFLQQTSDVNMVIDPAVKAHGKKPITLKMTQASLKLALYWILELGGLDYELRDGAIFVTTPGRLRPAKVMLIHDINDLTAPLPDHAGPEMDLAGRRISKGPELHPIEPFPGGTAGLVEMIRRRVRPASWRPTTGTSIEERKGKLVVNQSHEIQREIAALLGDLRSKELIPLEVSAQFYAVAPDKLAAAGKAGRLLAGASAFGRNGQRLYALRGKTWPATDKRGAVFTGALLDVRPVLSIDRRNVLLHCRIGLGLAGGAGGDPVARVRVYRAPVSVRVAPGKPASFPLGAIPGKKGQAEVVVCVLSVAVRGGGALAPAGKPRAEPAWKVNLRKALEKKVNLGFANQPLEECINYIRGLTDVSVITDTKAFAAGGVDPKMPVTLRLENTKLGLALKWILRMAKLDYRLTNGAVFISTPDRLGNELAMNIYDVRELTVEPGYLAPPKVDTDGSFPGCSAKVKTVAAPPGGCGVNSIQDLIKRVIRPTTWGAGGASIEQRAGHLMVIHRPEVHEEIAALIAKYRASVLQEVRVDVALYELPAGAGAGDAKAVEKSGRLLSRLAAVGLNGRRLHAAGGVAWPAPRERPGRFAGALLDVRPTLSADRRYVALEARLLWLEPDLSSAGFKGTLLLEVGRPAMVALGAADGRKIVAIVRPAIQVRASPSGAGKPGTGAAPAPAPVKKKSLSGGRSAVFFRRKIQAMLDRAKFDYQRQKYDEAEAIVQQVLRLDPKNAAARKLLARIRSTAPKRP